MGLQLRRVGNWTDQFTNPAPAAPPLSLAAVNPPVSSQMQQVRSAAPSPPPAVFNGPFAVNNHPANFWETVGNFGANLGNGIFSTAALPGDLIAHNTNQLQHDWNASIPGGVVNNASHVLSTLGNMGLSGYHGLIGDQSAANNDVANAKHEFDQTVLAAPFRLATTGGATWAGNDLLKNGYNPSTVLDAMNSVTNNAGINSNDPEATQKLIESGVTSALLPLSADVPGTLKLLQGGAKGAAKEIKNTDFMDETGSVKVPGGKQPPNTGKAAADALGITPEQINKARLANAQPPLPVEEITDQLKKMGPGGQSPIDVNAERNPFKSVVSEVAPGDYQKARMLPRAVSEPIKNVRDRWVYSMKQLQQSSPEEFKNFWSNIEKLPANASPQLRQAIELWREGANRVHASTVAIGRNTNYMNDWALHPWDLETEEDIKSGSGSLGSHQMARKHMTVEEGKQAGLKLGTDPIAEGERYFNGTARALHTEVAIKGMQEADAGTPKFRTVDFGNNEGVSLSKVGLKKARGLLPMNPSDNKIIKGARSANAGLKSTTLSLGQFHPLNIAGLRAAPTLAMRAHPIRAMEGLYGTFRPLFPGGKAFVEKRLNKALKDGVMDKAAAIGMPYGEAGYNTSGTFLKSGVGHEKIFHEQMPMMHDQVARSIIHDLEKKKIPLDSPQARDAGLAGNMLMGFLNKEAQNIPPGVRQAMSDWLLAGQFTPSKFATFKYAATKGGVAGSYARRAVVANVAAATLVSAGIGFAMQQKSDDVRDLLLRSLVDPAVPTPVKDDKGNTLSLRLPGTNASDAAKLIGMKLVRGSDGHLGINWSPGNMPSTVTDFLRARLSPFASDAVKLYTNSNFSNQPLYDPNAPIGTRVQQAGTMLASGHLPIGLQGLPQESFVNSHLPTDMQQVLNAQKGGIDPLIKSGLSSFGLTPHTDQTVGQGLSTARYYDALDQAKHGLDRQSADALDLFTGSKKNPVTGAYDVQPNYNDQRAKAAVILQNPKALDNLIAMNTKLAQEGQTVDPLWLQSKDNIVKALQYQAMPLGGPDRQDWLNKNKWYNDLSNERSTFFQSLPAGDPNKPKLDLQYPDPAPDVKALMDQYNNLGTTQKGQFIAAHPELVDQWKKQEDYTNKYREQLGLAPFKSAPVASPQLQSFMNTYNSASKAQRTGIRNADPRMYQNMIAFYDSVDLNTINKQGSVNMLQGEPDQTSKQNKAISGLAKDIYQNADGTYSIVPAGWMNGLSNGSGGGSGGKSSKKKKRPIYAANYMISSEAGHNASVKGPRIKKLKVKLSNPRGKRTKVSFKTKKV